MAKQSYNSSAQSIRITEPEVPNLELEVLNSVATPKEWALALNVTDRQVRLWATGEKVIPPFRLVQIIKQAKTFLMQHQKIEDAIDRALLATYGPMDKGRF